MAKIAIVHDWLLTFGGAERVLSELCTMFPDAPVYTLFARPEIVTANFPHTDIITSSLQRAPFVTHIHKLYTPFMPMAIEAFDLSQYDIVLSSSAFFAQGVVLKPKTRHICYSYSPMRSLWDRNCEYRGAAFLRHILRMWDRQASARVDEYIAISQHVRNRIKKFYQRDARVIYPPLVQLPTPCKNIPHKPGFYLIVSRLYSYKNIALAIDTFNKLGCPLIVIGDGPARRRFERISGPTVSLVGHLDDATMAAYYRDSRALIMPQEEDFGLTALEAMSFGKPVLALRRGGALETVKEGISGEFFDDPIPEALADGVRRLNENYSSYNAGDIMKLVKPFSLERFRREITKLISG